jgi:hypothetical protein
MNYSLAEHFKLYMYNHDKKILKVLVLTSSIGFMLTIFLTYYGGLYGASFSFLFMGIMMSFLRKNEAKKIKFTHD